MRMRQHVNPLGLSFEDFRGRRPELPAGRPVEIEVGCADAQFLFERAERDPERTYVGFEIRDQLVALVNEAAAERDLPVQAIFCNANHHLRALIPDGAVARAYLNFPDPWFKRRHRKRRMVDEALVGDVAALLEPGGELFVQTDVFSVALDGLYAGEMNEEILENAAGPWSFWKGGNPFGARSWREEHCEAEGMPIWRILYRRRAAMLCG